MKAIIEFDLNEPDDVANHRRFTKSLDMAIALWYISQLRKDLEALEDRNDLNVESVIDKIYTILNDHNINIDELCN